MHTLHLCFLELGLGELAQVKQVEKIKMKFDRRNRRVNVKTVKKEMWNVIKEAKQKSFIEKENIENEAEGPETNCAATTFVDMQEELQSKLEGENKGKTVAKTGVQRPGPSTDGVYIESIC